MRRVLSILVFSAALVVAPTGLAARTASGPTAQCRDGTYSYSAHRRGTCSWHHGVSVWLRRVPAARDTHADSARMNRSDWGNDWPLTVAAGVVSCRDGAVTFRAAGVTYAVNGTARMLHRGADIVRIWRRNPAIPGSRIDISPIIDRGLELC